MKLHEISVKRPIAVIMAILIFVVIGVYSLSMLPVEMMPEMEMNYALVFTSYSNAGSAEVESLITRTIEGAISSVSGIDTLNSQSSEGTSIVMASFAAGTDMDKAVDDMEANIDLIEDFLPEGCEDPMVMKLDMSMMPSAMMSISYEGYDLIQTKKFVEDNVAGKLESIDGVASISVAGARDRIIEIKVDPQKIYGHNITISSIAASIAAQNTNMPAGTTEGMNKKMSVRAMGKFSSLKDIENVPVNTFTGQLVYLKDIAEIKDTYSEYSNYARLNGQDAISITVTAESDANTVDVVNSIIEVLNEIKEKNPKFTYNMTMEQASFIEDAISSVASNAVTGALLAIIVLLLFLGNIKTSLVIGITMPISVITTFIGMYFSGMSLNVVSLGGLSLGVGMLVDNAVVVIENIYRRKSDLKEDAKTSAIKGAAQVVSPVVASVLTTCIVYVPILFIDNMMAVMFKQLAFSIIFSQLASLIVTFMIIPMFTSKMEDGEKKTRKLEFITEPFERMMKVLYGKYLKALKFVLANTKKTISFVLIVFVISLVVLGMLGMTLIPSTDEGTVTVSITMPQGTKLDDTNKLSLKAENIIKGHKNVETVFSNVGSTGAMSSITGAGENSASITVTLNDNRRKSTDDIAEEIRKMLKNIAGAEISVATSNTAMSGMTSDEITFEFSGKDDYELEKFVKEAEKILGKVKGVTETETSISDTIEEVRIKIDSDRAAKYGFNTATLSNLVKSVLDKTTASRYTESGSEYDIVIVYPEDYIKNYNQLKNLNIKSPAGQWVSLSDVADVVTEKGQTTLTRIDQKRVVSLTAKLYGENMGTVKSQFEKALDKAGIPEGVSLNTSGAFEIMIDAMGSLLVAILLGILLMYFVMAAQFENLKQPFIILFTIPLCMIGVVLALLVTSSPLSVVGCIGILMLTGIIVNNAIVLIDYANILRKENPQRQLDDVLCEAGVARMRPILMTSLTSVLGFLPMALSGSGGAAMMQPLAIVLIGGLLVGTLLTLFVIPAVYKIFEGKKQKNNLTNF